jgi:hypothetical protein
LNCPRSPKAFFPSQTCDSHRSISRKRLLLASSTEATVLQFQRIRGFSAHELLVAAAICALATASIVPFSLQTLRWVRLRTSVHEFARELHRARLLAIARGAAVRMEVDDGENRYRLIAADDPSGLLGAEHHTAEGIRFDALPARPLTFHPWGSASPAGSYVLSGSVAKIKVVVSLAGRLRVEEVAP